VGESTLFDRIAQGEASKADAISRVVAGTDAEWRAAALAVIWRLALRGEPFTTDDVWGRLTGYATPEPRAMGGVIKSAQAIGMIKPTGEWVLSSRPACNRRPVRVWVKA